MIATAGVPARLAVFVAGLLTATACASATELVERPIPISPAGACRDAGAGQCPPTVRPPTTSGRGVQPEPAKGQCRQVSHGALYSHRTSVGVVPCARRHNVETAAVIQAWGVLTPGLISATAANCPSAVARYAGVHPAGSRLHGYYFVPTPEQRRHGQSWVRCDVAVELRSDGNRVQSRTGSLRAVAAHGVPVWLRACSDRPPRAGQAAPLVSCARPHRAELLTDPVRLGTPGGSYPGPEVLRQRAHRRCAMAVHRQLPMAADSSAATLTAGQWFSGLRTVGCWADAGRRDVLPAR